MSYTVLARKWRPQVFDDITGQQHVTRTLTNAIEQNRVHHAFLFCGARGVGKTTAARVFAKALNCSAAERTASEPCGVCPACTEITATTSVDVFEIDGASNRGIDEIRALRDGVAYAPQRDRYKIYIIDEVHMLTDQAFNALLKTLEEPPSHVKFIFATTEPHKIPVTILSRCQRFDFKRIPRATMIERLEVILAKEEVNIDEGSLRLVARESEGSMRDALSLLDRIISFCGKEADHDKVAEVLGVADRSWLEKIVRAAAAHDAPSALAVVEEAFEFGLDLRQFATDLVHYLRDVIVLKVAGDRAGLTDLSLEETNVLLQLGADQAVEDLQRMANVLIKTAERLAHANFPRLELEMAVVRLCRMQPLRPIDQMVHRLQAIERHLSSGAPLPEPTSPAPSPSPPPSTTARPTAAPEASAAPSPGVDPPRRPTVLSAPQAVVSGPEAAQPAAEPIASAPEAVTDAQAVAAAPVMEASPAPGLESAPASSAAPVLETAPAPAPAPVIEAPPAPSHLHVVPAPVEVAPPSAPHVAGPPADEVPPPSAPLAPEVEAPALVVAATRTRTRTRLDNDQWEGFVEEVRERDAGLAGSLDQAVIAGLHDGVLTVAFAGRASTAQARGAEVQLEAWLTERFDGVQALKIETAEARVEDSPYQRRRGREEKARETLRKDLEAHPLVADIVNRFSGKLSYIELDDEGDGRR